MEFGISCSKVDDVGLVAHAENLGYDYCWATDSPMLRSNPWAVLALAATRTQTIRLGMGVAVPGLRVAPDTANGIATINRLAPGRTFLGVGTGNTAMRTLGRTPIRIKPYGDFLRIVRLLLNGEEADFPTDGVPHPVRFQNLHLNYIDVEHYIPMYVGGFGPRAQALAGEAGDGLITGIPRGGSIPQALANVQRGAARVERTLSDFHTSALVNLLMLDTGETLRSERVVNEIGSSIMANVHYLLERYKETGDDPPAYVLPIWDEYLAFHKTRESQRSHQKLHESHYSYLDPDEARFVTPEIIETFAIAGQPEELVEKLRVLESEGLNAVSFIPRDEDKYRLYEDFAHKVIARMKA
jgi:5,10-methylenetetrahydromethanopterin reductase